MKPATLPVLLVLALLAVPLVERTFTESPPVTAPAAAGMPGSGVAPGVAVATMDRGPIDSRPITATAAAGMPTSVVAPDAARAATVRDPGNPPLELVTVLPPPAGQPASRPLTRAEALASVMRSGEYQDTVPPLARLYFASFGRYPDYEGLNYYTGVREGGITLAEIAEDFARGREFEIRWGSLGNAEFVERLFVNVLGDPHQADVRAHWVAELDSGRMTRGQVIVDLSESGAFRERSANRVFVSAAFTEILQRTPDPQAYSFWVAHLDAGNSGRSVIEGLLRGP